MAAKQKQDLTINKDTHVFSADVKMSAFQPIDVKPVFGRRWITNGVNNANFDTYRNAYDDSPTNSSIINAFVNYVYG